ncbi:MAG: hypothetical protein VB104_07970 [Candidatus Limiplasma sp.]|nr:hypothetical protein [Candidatus Limiplasma sp.]
MDKQIIKTADAKTEDVAEIIIEPSAVSVSSPKNPLIIAAVKACGFTWDSDAVRWTLAISPYTGGAEDRAAEVGNALLCAGVPIILPDPQLAQRAVSGTFTPRCERWVRVLNDGSCFTLRHERNDALYREARRVLGARWNPSLHCLTVPVCRWQTLLDFADALSFRFAETAQSKIAELQRQKDAAVLVSPRRPGGKARKESVSEMMNQAAGVIPDLID